MAVKAYLRNSGKRTFLYNELPDYLKSKKWHSRAAAREEIALVRTVKNPPGSKASHAGEWRVT